MAKFIILISWQNLQWDRDIVVGPVSTGLCTGKHIRTCSVHAL